ncbi:alpha-glucan family phosphorylase [Desulfovibrio sp. OttesenSCG-928-I05]|nr:alpha-glucan family phosphorylase [Desulfovibrio sp. OttesenSCG-928-I05]
MQSLQVFSVTPKLPPELEPLWKIARNYWFAWDNDIASIFEQIDPQLWEESYCNPVWFINHVPQTVLQSLAKDDLFKERLQSAARKLDEYLSKPVPERFASPDPDQPVIAYFSLEFGASLCLPIYSGGLGILAGDHLKSASDLNVPLVGIGLLYGQGYFRQYMTPDAWQQERYPDYDFEQMPLKRALTPSGEPAVVHLSVGDRPLSAAVWEANIGRVRLFLLDTNLPENSPEFKLITSRLYGGNLEMRLWQEILLGIGGVKALKVLGLEPRIIHMNEGHSAFAGLERIRVLMKEQNLPLEAAIEVSASGSIFTTHTPVPAGNDRFPPELMQQYFEPYARDMGLAFKVFLALGREVPQDDRESFCMPVLALRLSRFNNGVSTLHGKVSRHMWHKVWNQLPVEDVPIGSITNGVHPPSWVALPMQHLYDRYLGTDWRENPDTNKVWSMAENIPDPMLWRTHSHLRARLVDFVRERVKAQLIAQGARSQDVMEAEEALNPEALTIGFARRFATYKRANLLIQDTESLLRVISNKDMPVQFIFAGKAHPADQGGKQLMKDLITLCRRPEYRMNMVFLEDYDMNVAAHMVSGCDVWLNNPRRPLEACGTSGMKAMFNGVLQFSTLDGWWDEAWKPDNSVGWAIGKGEDYTDPDYQDFVELKTLYKVLEQDIIPEFYDRGRGEMPRAWTARMKRALVELGPRYSSHRMVEDYFDTAYAPALRSHVDLCANNYAPARELSEWRMNIMTRWSDLQIKDVTITKNDDVHVGDQMVVEASIYTAGIPLENLSVNIYAGSVGQDNNFLERSLFPMEPIGDMHDGWQKFRGQASPGEAGRFGFTVQAMPVHPLLPNKHSLGLIRWA